MQLSNRERTIISRAESSVRRAKVGRIMMLALMLIGLALLVRMCAETESEEMPGVEDQLIDVLSRKP